MNGHDEFDIFSNFGFTFRDPEDVFREFFGGSPFDDIFRGNLKLRKINVKQFAQLDLVFLVSAHGRRGQRGHPSDVISTPFMSPFMGFGLMDSFFDSRGRGSNGFTSISEFNGGGFSPSSGPVKRTSTSTTFVNGKKLMTKR
jgi:DnaJ family protein B protein 6